MTRRGPLSYTRLSYDELEAFIASEWGADDPANINDGGHPDPTRVITLSRVGRICGVHHTQIQRWRREGGLTVRTADHVAIRLGVHPSAIWADFAVVPERQGDLSCA